MIHYEVESELNSSYAETNDPDDYYGIYYVVKYDGDTRNGVMAIFEADYHGDGRALAYALARTLQEAEDGHCA